MRSKAALVAWIAVSLLAIGASFYLDGPVREAVVRSQGKGWKKSDDFRFHSAVRRYGDWPELMLAGGLGLLVSWRLRNREWMRILAAAMIASTAAGIVANASRLTTGRTRPNIGPQVEQGFYGPWNNGRLTVGDRAYNSFPSGHTATAFGFAWVIVLARPWLGVGALLLASVIAWSSIVMGTHHLSDVVVSIILSLPVAWTAWRWSEKHGGRAWLGLSQWLQRRRRS